MVYRASFPYGDDILFSGDKSLEYVVEQVAITARNRRKLLADEFAQYDAVGTGAFFLVYIGDENRRLAGVIHVEK